MNIEKCSRCEEILNVKKATKPSSVELGRYGGGEVQKYALHYTCPNDHWWDFWKMWDTHDNFWENIK